MRLKLGFVDDTENICFLLSIYKMKMATDEELSSLGVSRQTFSNLEEREEFFNQNSVFNYTGQPLIVSADKTLEEIWIEEALLPLESKVGDVGTNTSSDPG